MKTHVFKRKRKVKGKIVTAQNYTGRYKLANDPCFTVVNLGVSEKQTAEKLLRDIALQAEREGAGLAMPKKETECLNAPLSELLEEYIGELDRLGRSYEHTRHISARVLALGKECGWKSLRDINADSFRQWRKKKKASVKTLNEYQNAITSLLNWIGKTRGINIAFFDSVEHIDARGHKSFERRALNVAEACALLACAPLKRRVAYALALFTGLRRGEIEALEWRDLDLDGEHPSVEARASTTKNAKSARLSLHTDLVTVLREWRTQENDPSDLVLPDGIPQNRLGLWLDLKAAQIERTDSSKRKVDFHALRHTTCTLLMSAGVPARVVQNIMRHSDLRLTSNIYTDAGALPTENAISKIPSLLGVKQWTQDLTHGIVQKGLDVSQAVTEEKKGKVDFTQYLQGPDTGCHIFSQPAPKSKMAERGGFGPPVPDLTSTAV